MNKVYGIVLDRILAEMERGVVPWMRPWFGSAEGPRSYLTGKPYSVLNQILLGEPGAYVTFKHLKQLGGRLKQGAKSKQVVFWKIYEVEEKKEVPVLRYYNVFHESLCEGIAERSLKPLVGEDEVMPTLEEVKEHYLKREKIALLEGSDGAWYVPGMDVIHMPAKTQFLSLPGYYQTLFHEIVHSTGHENRLGRLKDVKPRWSTVDHSYNKEELVAELGSMFLLHRFGCVTEDGLKNSSSYIYGWSKAFRDDPRIIVGAAAQAERAVRFILDYGEE